MLRKELVGLFQNLQRIQNLTQIGKNLIKKGEEGLKHCEKLIEEKAPEIVVQNLQIKYKNLIEEGKQAVKEGADLKGVKFNYGILKNINKIKPEIESLQESSKPTPEFQEFEKKRVELAKECAKKDDKDKPVIEGDQYQIEDRKAFDKKLDKMREESKVTIDAREKQIEEYNKMLDEEVSIDLYKIKLDVIPEDITSEQMNSISEIIEE